MRGSCAGTSPEAPPKGESRPWLRGRACGGAGTWHGTLLARHAQKKGPGAGGDRVGRTRHPKAQGRGRRRGRATAFHTPGTGLVAWKSATGTEGRPGTAPRRAGSRPGSVLETVLGSKAPQPTQLLEPRHFGDALSDPHAGKTALPCGLGRWAPSLKARLPCHRPRAMCPHGLRPQPPAACT